MKRPTTAQCSLIALVAVLAVAVHLSVRVNALSAGIARVIEQNEKPPQSVTQTTTRATGSSIEVTTTRIDGEGLAQFRLRHDDAVRFFKEK